MTSSLRVLIVEDSEDDMLLMLRELRRGGYAVDCVRVETAAEMQSMLEQQSWDIIIADYSLPAFSAPQALQLLQDLKLDLPFIIVSGKIGEETAVAAMKAGAHDYLTKGNLTRLVPAVERELREALERQKRKSAEQALRESEERYRLLFESNPNPMWVFDLETLEFLAVNEAAIAHYGYSKDEFLSMTVSDLCPPEDTLSVEPIEVNGFNGRNHTGVGKHLRRDGKRIDVEVVAHTFVFGGKSASLVLINDITEKKHLEAQLLRAQRLESLGTLASGIAHDFNNILTPILAAAQLLPLQFPEIDGQGRELLRLIEESTKRGADLITQILAFARGVDGKRVALQVRHVLLEVRQVIRQTFPKNIEIDTNISTQDLWTVSADATQLHQVFMNLCVNARDAMSNGGKLSIAIENRWIDVAYARMYVDAHVGPYVVITVADTGTGISDDLLERIFDPFFTTKEQGKGTGLGLSTVLGIVKNHDGFIQVESVSGKGTCFSVYLPAIEAEESPKTEDSKLLMGGQELVLVVDDEPSIRQVAQTVLESHNYKTLTASDGIEAIAIYAEYKDEIGAVLMDMMMPSLDGLTALRTLQKMNPQLRAIATSGLVSNNQISEAAEFGVKAFLAKPYTAQELLDTLHKVLQTDTYLDQ